MRATFALTQRSLLVAARTWRTYWVRMVLVAMVMFWLISAQNSFRSTAPGLRLFLPVVWSNVVFLSVAGLYMFAAAIAEEKDLQTLPLLRMSNLSSVSILFGKGTSQFLAIVLLILCQLPFTMLAMTLGGVSPVQVYATYANLLGYVAILAGIGTFASVARPNTAGAAGMATGLLMLVFLGPVLAYAIADQLVDYGWIARDGWVFSFVGDLGTFLYEVSPFTALMRGTTVGFAGPVFGVHLAYQAGFGVAMFLVSWLAFDRFNRHEAPSTVRSWWRPGGAKSRTSGAVWSAMPFAWKDYRFIAGGSTWLVLKFVLYGGLIAVVAFAADSDTWRALQTTILILCIPLLVFELAVVASRVFSTEIQDKTVPVLVMLPTSLPAWAYSKVLGATCAAIPAAIWIAVGAVPLLSQTTLTDILYQLFSDLRSVLGVAMFVLYGLTYLHLVAWLSLYTRGSVVFGIIAMQFGTMAMTLPMVIVGAMGLARGRVAEYGMYGFSITVMVLFCAGAQLLIGRKLVSLASAS